METWSGNGNHARHAKERCYVMLGFSVKVREYQETKLNAYVFGGGGGGALTPKGSSGIKKVM